MRNSYRHTGGLAVIATAAAIGLAACGGSPSRHVASLGNGGGSGSGTTTTTLPKGNPSQLLDEWASCMRSHGDPNQVDPTVDANKVIHITFPPGANGNGPDIGKGNGSNSPCDVYLTAASTALRGGKPLPKPDPVKLEKLSKCVRAHGIPDFPDPSPGGGLSIQASPGSDLNPRNPTFHHAMQLCAKKYGIQGLGGGTPPPGAIEATSSGAPAGGPGGNGGAKSNSVSVGG
jgi:hypothetical protein